MERDERPRDEVREVLRERERDRGEFPRYLRFLWPLLLVAVVVGPVWALPWLASRSCLLRLLELRWELDLS